MREDVKQAISEFKVSTFGSRKEIERAESLLETDEQVLFVYPTALIITSANTRKSEELSGVVFLTNRRFLYYSGMYAATEYVPLEDIQAVNFSEGGLFLGHVEIHTCIKTYAMSVTNDRSLINKICSTFENARRDASTKDRESVKQPDILDQIEKLASLREKGILTEDEFQQKKKELLAKL